MTLCDGQIVRMRDLPPRLMQKLNISASAEEPAETAALPEVPDKALYSLQTESASAEGIGPPQRPGEPFKPLKTFLRDQEVVHLNRALGLSDGDKEKAALLLGVSLATLYRKLAGEDREP